MDQLDNNKIPKIGTPGEKYRDIQLIIQLPKQDLSEEYCRNLKTATQKKAFDDFRNLRDSTSMDIGHVREYVKEDKVAEQSFSQITITKIFLTCHIN